MSTTTIRMPDELKARVTAAAEKAGTTAHSFILQAIAEKAQQQELYSEFNEQAERRYAAILATGKTIPWNEMRTYLEQQFVDEPDSSASDTTEKLS
jgi:predicted transcriptional regulator